MCEKIGVFSKQLIVVLTIFFLTACSIATSTSSAQLKPTAIIVRNNSGINYASASLAGLQENSRAARAFGQLAPIPTGVEQVYGRATRAPALPDRVEFRLQTYQGQTITREFQLDSLAQDAEKITSPYVLIFELQPGGEVRPLLQVQ
jgi:hypothetical protein